MSRLLTSGAEMAVADQGMSIVGTVTRDTLQPRAGGSAACWKCAPGAGATTSYITAGGIVGFSGSTSYFMRAYMRFEQFPASTARNVVYDGQSWSVRLTSAGKLQLWNDAVGQVGSDSTALSTGTYYRVEVKITQNASNKADQLELLLDGVTVATSATGLNLTDSGNIRFGFASTTDANAVCYIDDCAWNSSAGANQNTYPGPGVVVCLRPVSDNARSSGMLAGAGATTSLFDAEDNSPPAGVALASATNTSQVKDAANNATDNLDLNCTDYATAGVPTTATINVVQAVANGANSSTTSRTLGVALVSNPAVAETTFATGATAGAAYPTGWTWHRSSASIAPAVTRGTQPVLRLGKRTASTDSAMFDGAGIVVDFTPVTAISQTMAVSLETTSAAAATTGEPVEAAKLLTGTAAESLETLQPLAAAASEPGEALNRFAAAIIEALEAAVGLQRTSFDPAEATRPLTGSAAAALELLQATQQTTGDLDDRDALLGDLILGDGSLSIYTGVPLETLESIAAGIDQAIPAEAEESVAGTADAAVDAAHAVAAAAAAAAESTTAVVATGDASPLETLTTAAATADAPLSALQRLQQTAAAPLEVLGPVLTSISQTATVVVDALERLTLRATAPLEPGSRVSRTVALWIDGRRRRRRSEAVLTGKDGMISADSSSNEADTSAGGIS